MNFFEHYIVNESPDNMNGISWVSNNAIPFTISPKFTMWAVNKIVAEKHAYMYKALREFSKEQNNNLHFQQLEEWSTYRFQGDFTDIKSFLQENTGKRSKLLELSRAYNLGILIGRVWRSNNQLSLWNNISDLTHDNLRALESFIYDTLKIDPSNFKYELFAKDKDSNMVHPQQYNIEQLWELVDNGSSNAVDDVDWSNVEDQAHTMVDPNIRKAMMKDKGIKPKAAMGVQARYAKGESFIDTFNKMVIKENPDEWFDNSDAITFILTPSAIIYSTNAGHTHGDIFVMLHCIKRNAKCDYDIAELVIKGSLSNINTGYKKEAWFFRNSFVQHNPDCLLGRVSESSKVVSYWSTPNIKPEQVVQTVKMLKLLNIDPAKMFYEFTTGTTNTGTADDKVLTAAQFRKLYYKHDAAKPTNISTDHIVHNVDPAKKAQALKAMGVKPKAAMGVQARYAQGESTQVSADVLLENPDTIYKTQLSGMIVFIMLKDYMAWSDDKSMTHWDLLDILQQVYLEEAKIEDFDNVYAVGEPPEDFIQYLSRTGDDATIGRGSFLSTFPNNPIGRFGYLGGYPVFSVWNQTSCIDQNYIDMVEFLLQDSYNINLEECTFEFGMQSDKLSWEQVLKKAGVKSKEKPKPAPEPEEIEQVSQIVHNVDPAKKAQALKAMGVKPKAAMGVQARYAQGESFTDFYQTMLQEAPIGDIEFHGDWSPKAKAHGWDKPSQGILTSQAGIQKIRKLWDKTSYDFDLYMVRSAPGKKAFETGEVSLEQLHDTLGINITPKKDHITAIYTNNIGANRVPTTAWTLAHRLGHALLIGNRDYYNRPKHMRLLVKEVYACLSEVAQIAYGVAPNFEKYHYNIATPRPTPNYNKVLMNTAYAIGTFKSARDRNINNLTEFVLEIFAQYIIQGEVKFKRDLPPMLVTSNAWGKPNGPRLQPNIQDDINEILAVKENDLTYTVDNILGANVNKIFIM